MTDVEKRKAPEAATEGEAPAKKQRTTPPDMAALRKQVEYYLCDDNLRHDRFFHEKITADAEGWLDLSFVLSCKKIKAMGATKEQICDSLKSSTLEVRLENDGPCAVRRP